MTLWFASGNAHKHDELRRILGAALPDIPVELLDPRRRGAAFEPDERGLTFVENALIKARALYARTGGPVIADDSGLCVDALGGLPGVYSARYRGRAARYGADGAPAARLDDGERNAVLLRDVEGAADRRARFVCAMALLLDEHRFFCVQETLEGEIAEAGRGAGGFGYDPLLYLPRFGRTVAELSADEKHRVSHRGKAARALAPFIRLLARGGPDTPPSSS